MDAKKNGGDILYEPKGSLSTSSSSSDSSSDNLSDEIDKEIEEISIPIDYKQNSIESIELNNIDEKLKFLYDQKPILEPTINKKSTPPVTNGINNLLNNVNIIDNEYDDFTEPLINQVNENNNNNNNKDQRNWPNPPILGSRSKNIPESQQPNDQNLLHELIHMMRLQQNDIEVMKKQQINTILSLKSHFDSTIQTIRQQNQQSSTSSSSLVVNEENLAAIINQTLLTQIMPKLEKYVKDEMRQTIQPQVIKIVEPFREQIPRELAEKLRATENLLKDNISKMFKSKTFLDSISQSVGNSIQTTVVNAYRDSFQKVVIPGFEKSCQSMYQQINATFKKGSDDYIQELENYLKQQRKINDEQKDPLVNQLKQYNDNFNSSITQLNTTLTNSLQGQLDQNLRTSNAVLQDTIISSVKAIIKEELNVAMRDQQHHLPERLVTLMRQTGTMTPVVYSAVGMINSSETSNEKDVKQSIKRCLQQGELNNAFVHALCASDLNLLMSVCETVNPQQLFDQKPCPLQQQVLLSLIQQLSSELTLHTELKLKYLEEALMSLDQNSSLTREHSPQVINPLQQKLLQYINAHPNEKITKSMRMLLMASQAFVKS